MQFFKIPYSTQLKTMELKYSIFKRWLFRYSRNCSVNNTISGHFHFDAYNGTGQYTINVSEGVFYKIPVNSGEQD